jgi:branched-chain amino acid transport system permease protein
MTRRDVLWLIGFGVVLVAVTNALSSNLFDLDIVTLVLIWALASSAWNLIGGYQRQLALGHSAFFAIGAYSSALLYLRSGVSPWIGMWVGFVLAAALSAFVAWLCLRLKGAFYALATFALASVAQIVATIWVPVTGGDEGLSISYAPNPANFIFDSTQKYIYVFGGMLVIYMILTLALARSRWGLASLALSTDEDAAGALGVRVLQLKVLGAALSGGLTAIAGTAYAQYLLYVHPTGVASIQLAIQVSLIAVFGGAATVYGPILGAAILIPLSSFLSATLGSGNTAQQAPGLTWIVYGVVLMLVLLYFPEGVGPRVGKLLEGFAGSQRLAALRGKGT